VSESCSQSNWPPSVSTLGHIGPSILNL